MLNRIVKQFLTLGKERGVDLNVVHGSKHIKLFYGPHLIAVVSAGKGPKGDYRAIRNKTRDFYFNLEKAIEHEQGKSTRGSEQVRTSGS